MLIERGKTPQSFTCSRRGCECTYAHIRGSAHMRRPKPIIQSERAHKFWSLVAAACSVKVRALFLSERRRLTDPRFLCLHLCNSSLPAGLLAHSSLLFFAFPPRGCAFSTTLGHEPEAAQVPLLPTYTVENCLFFFLGKRLAVFCYSFPLTAIFLLLLVVVLPHNVSGTLHFI